MQYGAETESRLASASQAKAEHQSGTLKRWDSVVSGVTGYELDFRGWQADGGEIFNALSDQARRPTQPPVQYITGHFWT
jgi:hypothetical protein